MIQRPPVAREPRHLLLVDIDGTLIQQSGQCLAMWADGWHQATGGRWDPAKAGLPEGSTTRAKVRAVLRAQGRRCDDVAVADVLANVSLSFAARFRELEGTSRLVDGALAMLYTARQCGVPAVPVTANPRAVSVTKLVAAGLEPYLALQMGGYGCSADDRTILVDVATTRASVHFGVEFDAASTTYIGDTVVDMECAAGRAYRIGVASGKASPADLRAAGADLVVTDLSDPAVMDAVQRSQVSA